MLKEGFIKRNDGIELKTRAWFTDKESKAQIIFCHGLFEYAGRWQYEAKYFNDASFDFLSYDQRSHGESGGKHRAYIGSMNNYIEDFKAFIQHCRKDSDKPFFLFAHSFGAMILISHLVDQKIDNPLFRGVILSGPFIEQKSETAPILQKLAGVIATLMPTFKTIGVRPNSISRDPEEVKKYINDPLVYTGGMYASTGYQVLKQVKFLKDKLNKFDYPFLLMHGTNDELTEIKASQKLHDVSPSNDKTFIPLKDFKHEITRDIGRDEVLKTMVNWVEERV